MTVSELKDGMILPGKAPDSWGFTEDRFKENSYLWRVGSDLLISFVWATQEGKGYFSSLVRSIENDGLRVKVPTPLGRMEMILRRWGFHSTTEEDSEMGPVEMWVR